MTPVTVYDLPLDVVFSVSLCLFSHFSLSNSKGKLAHTKFLSISSGQSTNPFETLKSQFKLLGVNFVLICVVQRSPSTKRGKKLSTLDFIANY